MYILEKAFLGFFQTSLTVSIILMITYLLLRVFKNKINVRIKYMLCILIALRLLVPVIPQTNINISKITNSIVSSFNKNINTATVSNQTSQSTRKTFEDTSNDKIVNSKVDIENTNETIDLFKILVYISSRVWVLCSAILLTAFLIFSLKFRISSNKSKKEIPVNLNEEKNKIIIRLNIRKDIPVYVCENINSPCILGIVNTKIYIPKDIFKLNDDNDITYILLHELIHYKRKDLVFNLIAITALALHWYNPLVWILVSKIKLYREYACDAGVLEFLGEEQNVEYGMTLINFSKIFINKNKYSKLAICFETNNKIGERIKMIKRFENGSYKISSRAALSFLVAATVVFTNGVSVKALDASNLDKATEQVQLNTQSNNSMLIDRKLKIYNNINKPVEIAGFNFKLPNYIIEGNSPHRYAVNKLADNTNCVEVSVANKENKNNYGMFMFKGDPITTFKQINEFNYYSDDQVETSEEEMNIGSIKGKSIKLIGTKPEHSNGEKTVPESKITLKYLVWEDNGVNYSIMYSAESSKGEKHEVHVDVPEAELEKVAESFKSLDKITGVDYKSNINNELSEGSEVMNIYDKDDLNKASEIIGFTPKFPLKINDKVSIENSFVMVSGDSNIENNKVYYDVNFNYDFGENEKSINFYQSNHDSFDTYKNIKENGYIQSGDEKINVETMDVSGKTVYKFMGSFKYPNGTDGGKYVGYEWENNGVYYGVQIVDVDGYQDDIANAFIDSTK